MLSPSKIPDFSRALPASETQAVTTSQRAALDKYFPGWEFNNIPYLKAAEIWMSTPELKTEFGEIASRFTNVLRLKPYTFLRACNKFVDRPNHAQNMALEQHFPNWKKCTIEPERAATIWLSNVALREVFREDVNNFAKMLNVKLISFYALHDKIKYSSMRNESHTSYSRALEQHFPNWKNSKITPKEAALIWLKNPDLQKEFRYKQANFAEMLNITRTAFYKSCQRASNAEIHSKLRLTMMQPDASSVSGTQQMLSRKRKITHSSDLTHSLNQPDYGRTAHSVAKLQGWSALRIKSTERHDSRSVAQNNATREVNRHTSQEMTSGSEDLGLQQTKEEMITNWLQQQQQQQQQQQRQQVDQRLKEVTERLQRFYLQLKHHHGDVTVQQWEKYKNLMLQHEELLMLHKNLNSEME